ncbi:hypothetical protein KIN20_001211 [Parelaphostrongylus tenuis]|uniref:Uncharacterized protein n=1 Tax=Parelaphostrongylus tenuis TaxID=148309 RepID=A0AAD5QED7_PARTN|nr:hypothetical protein KIN20_001211 [Parelaphostrongylus tenuis]
MTAAAMSYRDLKKVGSYVQLLDSFNEHVHLTCREVDEIMCSPLRVSNGKLVNEVIPQTSHFQISIVFTNITDGDVVLLDDVAAQFNECSVPTKTFNVLRGANMTKTSTIGSSVRKPHERHSGHLKRVATSIKNRIRRRFCQRGECISVIHGVTTLNSMCVGRIGVLQCREKCKKNGGRNSARCARQSEFPYIKRCLCHIRRSPLHRVDGGSYYKDDMSRNENESFTRREATSVERLYTTKSASADYKDQQAVGRNEVQLQENVCTRKNGDEICNRNCKTSNKSSFGQCQADVGQLICRCSSCVASLCDFEKDDYGST